MKAEYIAFWILITMVVGIAIWKLIGSPTDTATLITTALFIAGSEILIWRAMFEMDKKISIKMEKIDNKTAMGFEKIKNDMNNNHKEINSRLSDIESLIKRRK